MSNLNGSEHKDARMALTSASDEGASHKIEYALVSEGKHAHLYFRTDKTKQQTEKWQPGPCLGGVPQGMFCAWRTGPTNFIQHKFRNEDTMFEYLLKRMSEEQAFRLLDDIRMRVDELEQEMVEA
jgi:hypothetical protein